MKFKNNNNSAIKKLSTRILKANKIRNIFAIFAIVLTTVMFTSLFTIGGGIIESQQYTNMRTCGGSAHASFKYLDQEKLEKLRAYPSIKKYGYSIMLSRGENKEFSKISTEMRYADDNEAKMCFSYPTQGNMPKEYDELVTDTKVLDALNIPHKVGEKITIKYKLGDKEKTHDFIVSGFWEGDAISPASEIYLSYDFVQDEIKSIDPKTLEELKGGHGSNPGEITLDVMFSNSLNIVSDVKKVISDSGYSENQIATGVNWAYNATNFDGISELIIPVLALCLLVMFSGYLIIYNIFQISVVNDIKSYGLLKTIGTNKKQIKCLIRKQASMLCVIGIPIGLVVGYIIGSVMLPYILSTSNNLAPEKNMNPLIFIFSALFAIITVYISCNKPGRVAGKISPIEAFKYCEIMNEVKGKKVRKSRGAKIYKMSLYNLARNKKKTFFVIVSMSLSIVLLNCVYTFTNSFSMDKYISKNIVVDFVVANSNYFSVHKEFKSKEDVVSESIINNINESDYFKDGGRIYYSLEENTIINNGEEKMLQIYGFDDFPISKLEVVQGDIDINKLKSGKYVLEAVGANDKGQYVEESHCSVGDKISIKSNNSTKEYEVMAVVGINNSLEVRYRHWNEEERNFVPQMILPSNEFCNITNNPTTMSYVYDVKDGELENAENYISNYTENIEKDMMYHSKQTFIKEFEDFKNMFNFSGGVLIIIIGIIGILNFINSILTSIISRKREFATIESIGMTKKQLKQMLILEGLDYGIITLIVSIALSIVTSLSAVKAIVKGFWFCKYVFTLKPILVLTPFMVIFAVLVPILSYKSIGKLTIIERLRECE